MKKSVSIFCIAALLCTLAACSEQDIEPALKGQTEPSATESVNEPTEANEERQIHRSIPPFAIGLDDLRGASSIRNALVEQMSVSRAIEDGRMSADAVEEQYLTHPEHKIAEITDFYFPTAEIRGFELSSVTILGGQFSFCYTPLGNRSFNIGTGVLFRVTRTDAEFDDLSCSPTLEELQGVFGGKIEGELLFAGEGIIGLVGETWFITNAHTMTESQAANLAREFIDRRVSQRQ
jgi:hypothetical protein